MIDLHSHILPGLDDGPASMEETLEMARMAVREGIDTVFATPHHLRGSYRNRKADVLDAVTRCNAALRAAAIPLQVRAGQEIRLDANWVNEAYEGQLLTLGGTSYVLIELPSEGIPDHLEESFHEMDLLGWTPIIAHPERNREIARYPDRLKPYVEAGALCQLTSQSLTGYFGGEAQAAAVNLCKRGYAHVVASDAHDCTRRPFELRAALAFVEDRFGHVAAKRMERNARLVAAGRSLDETSTARRTAESFSGWLRGRLKF